MQEAEQSLLERLEKSMMDIVLHEDVDTRLKRLAKEGLIDSEEYALFIKTMSDLESEKKPTPAQRMLIMRLFDQLLSLIMSDKIVYQKVLQNVKKKKQDKSKMQKEAFLDSHTIVEHKGIKYYVSDDNALVPVPEEYK